MYTVAIKTLGCKVNLYESDAISNLFEQAGYQVVDINELADVYVINTCTVTNSGDKKSRQAIRQAVRRNPQAIIVVAGCYTQLKANDVAEIEGVDIILGTSGRERIVSLVDEFRQQRQPIIHVADIMKQKEFEELNVVSFASKTRAFIKIQEGCNNFCTFCIIPWARGLLRSQDKTVIIQQITDFVQDGVKEVVLTGIHTGGYGEDLADYSFADLLREIKEISGLQRLRISSIEITQLSTEVLDVLQSSSVFVDHLHIPIQAASDDVLSKMRRNYQLAEYRSKISEIRSIFPQIAITTDIIVGFPGETDLGFASSLNVVREIGFSEMHVFPYSQRQGTPASRMEDQVSDQDKKQRVQQMIELNEHLAINYAKQFIDQELEVLFEVKIDDRYIGYSQNYLKIEVQSSSDLRNQIATVILKEVAYPLSKGILK